VRRISSRYSTPVEFGDRRDFEGPNHCRGESEVGNNQIYKSIGWFDSYCSRGPERFEQGDARTRVCEEAERQKVDDRTLIESLTEVTNSFASGQLKGVIILEKGYNDKTEEAWVVVGISDRTIKAADGVETLGKEKRPGNIGGPDSLDRQPSEIRRTNQKDF
jgi:hypothetical protein